VAEREHTRLSKFLSLVLRHQPEVIGVTLDPAGWVPVDELLAACDAHGKPIDRALLLDIVATSPKQRFALSEDGARIRASQGHSVDVELGHDAAQPPETLYHGTVAASLDAIRAGGLSRMERHHVHLSPDADTARAVGARRGAPVVLRVAAGAMHRAGHVFHRSANGVWLTEHVPPAFIELPPAREPGSGADPR
jgi:putative RNA 2'-phosphotransferase